MTSTRPPRRLNLRDDTGTTLLELIVAMGILTIFMGIFTTATLMMTRSTSQVEAVAQAVDQGNGAFLQLEETARYATGISVPDRSTTGIWNVELASVVLGNGTTTESCTQLRVLDGKLSRRTWQPSGAGFVTGTLTSWRPLASNVTNGAVTTGDDVPFVAPVAAGQFRRLTVVLVTTGGPAGSTASNRTSAVFTAQNSTATASNVCAQVPVEFVS